MTENWLLFLSLLLAHVLADFVFQTRRGVAQKHRPWTFAGHIVVVAVLAWCLSGDWTEWRIPAVVAGTHAVFDAIKLGLTKRSWNPRLLFAWDQAAHLAVLAAVACWIGSEEDYVNAFFVLWGEPYARVLVLLTGLVVTVPVGGIVIGMSSARFLQQIQSDPERNGTAAEIERLREGLRDGGRVIGQLERSLIFFFVLVGQPEAVAFLVAAKSVFRFGELTRHSRKEAEYILIGTLMSFGWGLVAAWLTSYCLQRI